MINEQNMAGLFVGANLPYSRRHQPALLVRSKAMARPFGGYFVSEPLDRFYIDGYTSLGYRHAQISMNSDILALEGDYTGSLPLAGFGLTGVIERAHFEIWPQLRFEYGWADIGTVGFDAQAYGLKGSLCKRILSTWN